MTNQIFVTKNVTTRDLQQREIRKIYPGVFIAVTSSAATQSTSEGTLCRSAEGASKWIVDFATSILGVQKPALNCGLPETRRGWILHASWRRYLSLLEIDRRPSERSVAHHSIILKEGKLSRKNLSSLYFLPGLLNQTNSNLLDRLGRKTACDRELLLMFCF